MAKNANSVSHTYPGSDFVTILYMNSFKNEFKTRKKNMTVACREIIVPFLYGEKLREIPIEELRILLGSCAERACWLPFFVVFYVMQLIHELTTKESILDRNRHSLRVVWRRVRARFMLRRVVAFFARICRNNPDLFAYIVADLLTGSEEIPGYQMWLNNDDDDDDQELVYDDSMCNEEDENPMCTTTRNAPGEFESFDVGSEGDEHDIFTTFDDEHIIHEMSQTDFDEFELADAGEHVQEVYRNLLKCDEVIVDGPAVDELQRLCSTYDCFREIMPQTKLIMPRPAADSNWYNCKEKLKCHYGMNLDIAMIPIDELPVFKDGYRSLNMTKQDFYIAKYAVYFLMENPRGVLYCSSPSVQNLCKEYVTNCIWSLPEQVLVI